MKKIILCVLFLTFLFLTGCDLANNPTSRVESFINDYQMLDKNISTNYQILANGSNLSEELKERYQRLIEKQYRNLSYEVKDEEIDGDEAEVTVQVKVVDYRKAFLQYNMTDNEEDYYRRVADSLEDEKEKVVYTIEFEVLKDNNGTWIVSSLEQDDLDKILGIYSE